MVVHQGFGGPIVRVRIVQPGPQSRRTPCGPCEESREIVRIGRIGNRAGPQTVLGTRFSEEGMIVVLQTVESVCLSRSKYQRVSPVVIPISFEIVYRDGPGSVRS